MPRIWPGNYSSVDEGMSLISLLEVDLASHRDTLDLGWMTMGPEGIQKYRGVLHRPAPGDSSFRSIFRVVTGLAALEHDPT